MVFKDWVCGSWSVAPGLWRLHVCGLRLRILGGCRKLLEMAARGAPRAVLQVELSDRLE